QVAVTDVPLAELAGRMGLPSTWKLAGRLTGTISLDAESGAVRRVRGQLTANAGELRAAEMSQEFRWNTASASLDWDRKGMMLRGLRVRGDGIELAGTAVLTGSPEEMATRATYRAHGVVQIVGHRAVERVGELL